VSLVFLKKEHKRILSSALICKKNVKVNQDDAMAQVTSYFLSPQRPGFISVSLHVEFVVENVAL
jgi:hypothetical protein